VDVTGGLLNTVPVPMGILDFGNPFTKADGMMVLILERDLEVEVGVDEDEDEGKEADGLEPKILPPVETAGREDGKGAVPKMEDVTGVTEGVRAEPNIDGAEDGIEAGREKIL